MPISKMFMSILKRLPKSKSSAVLKDKEKLRRMAKDLDDYAEGPYRDGYDVHGKALGKEKGYAQGMRDHRRKRALEWRHHNIEDEAKKVRDQKKKNIQIEKDREAFVKKEEKKFKAYLEKKWGKKLFDDEE